MKLNEKIDSNSISNNIITSPEYDADESSFLEALRKCNGISNNPSLMAILNWEPPRYWTVRNRLLERGDVQKKKGGPGGTTFISDTPALETPLPITEEFKREVELYKPILTAIDTGWAGDNEYEKHFAVITGQMGRAQTGGTWTRPDITLVGSKKYRFVRDVIIDIVSFEIKPKDKVTVTGVFEALGHRQYTTLAYVIYNIGVEDFADLPEKDRIESLAKLHGIGVILAEKADDHNTWIDLVDARRWVPDPQDQNDFIQRIFKDKDPSRVMDIIHR